MGDPPISEGIIHIEVGVRQSDPILIRAIVQRLRRHQSPERARQLEKATLNSKRRTAYQVVTRLKTKPSHTRQGSFGKGRTTPNMQRHYGLDYRRRTAACLLLAFQIAVAA